VDSNCEKAIYVPETGANGVAEHDWNYAIGLTEIPADYFATPLGAVAIIIIPPSILCLGTCFGTVTQGFCDLKPF
jgi:hypothetical protein